MNQSINTDSKTSKEPQQKYRLGTVSIKILGGLNRFYGRPTSPSASIMAQNIQMFGPRGGFLTHQWIITWNKKKSQINTMMKQRWGLDRNVLRPTPGDPRTTPLEHWSRRKPTVEPRWAKQQTKKLLLRDWFSLLRTDCADVLSKLFLTLPSHEDRLVSETF